jgi:uncharacterized protein YdeI (YjbR/CyaY-like superfamily)
MGSRRGCLRGRGVAEQAHTGVREEAQIEFASRDAWTRWLDDHHGDSAAVWLKIAKRDSGIATVTHAEALEVALCFGWIDGQRRAHDETYFLQRFTPRRARSRWSRINRDKALELLESGQMRAAGLREVELAKADGRWDAAYEGQRAASVPDDLGSALDANPRARAFFETLDSQNRYSVIYRVSEAKRPETRARRIERFVAMLAEHRTLH